MFARPRPKKSLIPPPTKRRKTAFTIQEINFDFDARAEYLTGFHKRKVQRAKQAQEEAAKKAKEERIAARKQLREERRQELEQHVEAVNSLLVGIKTSGSYDSDDSKGEGWNGISDDQSLEPIDHEAEYVDEDRYTTVTVEAVEVSKEGLHKVADDGHSEEQKHNSGESKAPVDSAEIKTEASRRIWPKKTKRKKFRYESKAERKVTRGKQKAGNKVKADARRGSD